ncbi:glycosyltransferase [Methylomonas albis]|uniref:Glycosyltransferase n=1 Tax=Methylomonas albis TaxID=1854563 RepID=A0ABR9D5M9_9GAMM|nr:glycosyltransferase [Methylomonas albis]MBD9358414.1 glycosyltransferase [Methylomonas albis]
MEKLIAIYRTVYLLPSEAFIPSQLSGLRHYIPVIWYRDATTTNPASLTGFNAVCLIGATSFWKKVVFTLFGLAKLAQIPQLVHAHFGPDAAMILPFVKRNKLPLVVTYHGFDAQQSRGAMLCSRKLSNILFLFREKGLIRYASRIIVVSEFLKNCLINKGYPADKLLVHYIGVDTEKFVPGINAKVAYRLINISRHVNWKGVDTILRALPALIVKYPGLHLIQIGSGSETETLKRLADELGVSNHIEWLGALSHDKVLAELGKASLYIHASRQDSKGQTEAFGIALIEAQACGLPVVATRSGGIPEAIIENETGLLFEENDYMSLAFQVDELFSNPDDLVLKAKKARQFVVNKFDIINCSAKLENIYDEILTKSD